MGHIPKVSVLMPVYNGEKYLKEAIESVLSQTFADFEFIIIDDGSTDDSFEIVSQFNDSKIRTYSQANQGLAASLNRAIGLAKGEYLARQDADDISFPRRLEKQVEFLNARTDYVMVGTWAEIWKGRMRTKRSHKHPADNISLKFNLLFDNYFVHSSVMIRKTALDKIGLYVTEQERQPEDYELWSRIFREDGFKIANIPEVLVIYREVEGSISRTNLFMDRVVNLSAENLAWASGKEVHDQVITDISALAHNAMHRLSPKQDFRSMYAVLLTAAERLCVLSGQADPSLHRLARIRMLRFMVKYLRHRSVSFIGKVLKPFSASADRP